MAEMTEEEKKKKKQQEQEARDKKEEEMKRLLGHGDVRSAAEALQAERKKKAKRLSEIMGQMN